MSTYAWIAHACLPAASRKQLSNQAQDVAKFLDRLHAELRAASDQRAELKRTEEELARERKLRAFDIGDGWWQDIDSPETLAYALSVFDDRTSGYESEGAVSFV